MKPQTRKEMLDFIGGITCRFCYQSSQWRICPHIDRDHTYGEWQCHCCNKCCCVNEKGTWYDWPKLGPQTNVG